MNRNTLPPPIATACRVCGSNDFEQEYIVLPDGTGSDIPLPSGKVCRVCGRPQWEATR
jgi:ribosomal protein L40E